MKRSAVLAGLTFAFAGCTATSELQHPPAALRVQGGVTARSPRTAFVEAATAMLGQPYRYGGAAPGGFDCSGLVVYAGGNAGIRLPRTAQEQLHTGAPVSRDRLQPGDLVFMHLSHKELHVGIAVDADRFVHSPASGRAVRIDSLNAPPYARAFITARRVAEVMPPERPPPSTVH